MARFDPKDYYTKTAVDRKLQRQNCCAKLLSYTGPEATALLPFEGQTIYVSSVDGVFTDIGEWSYQGGMWVLISSAGGGVTLIDSEGDFLLTGAATLSRALQIAQSPSGTGAAEGHITSDEVGVAAMDSELAANALVDLTTYHTKALIATLDGNISANSDGSIILGGQQAEILSNSTFATVIGSGGPGISDGGVITETPRGVIMGSLASYIDDSPGSGIYNSDTSFIDNTGGAGGTGTLNVILGGNSNEISVDVQRSGIFAGQSNTITGDGSPDYNVILGGQTNDISGDNSSWCAIVGSENCTITGGGNYSAIVGSTSSTMTGDVADSVILGGFSSDMLDGDYGCAIIGGSNNTMPANSDRCVIIGGSAIAPAVAKDNTVFLQDLHIWGTPDNDDALVQVLVRDPADEGKIHYRTAASLGGGGTFGTDQQIPFMNLAGTDFDYDVGFQYDDANQLLTIGDAVASPEIRFNKDETGTSTLGFYKEGVLSSSIIENASEQLQIVSGSATVLMSGGWNMTNNKISGTIGNSAAIKRGGASLTVPIFHNSTNGDAGVSMTGENVILISNSKSALVSSDAGTATNVELFGSVADFGATIAGQGVLRLGDVTTVPTGTMTSGGLLYVDGEEIHFLSDAGNDTSLTEDVIICDVSRDEVSTLAAATDVYKFRMPYAATLIEVRGSLAVAGTGAALLTVDIHETGVTVLSTKLTFDASETTTTTAVTPAVISDAALADAAEITIDIDLQDTDTLAAGLKIYLKVLRLS